MVVTEFPPNARGGGGALVSQMLAGYPTKCICWWNCRPANGHRESHNFRHYQFPLPNRLYPNVRLSGIKAWLLEKFWVPLATVHLRKTVAQIAPDQIWLMLHAWSIPPIYEAGLVESHSCHASIWDYQDGSHFFGHFGRERSRRFADMAESLYQRAATCDAVSLPMLEDLAQRTGRRDAIIVHSGLEPAQLETIAADISPPTSEIRIAYAGTIIVSETFELFVRALESIRHKLSRPLRLEFFGGSNHHRTRWFNSEWMKEHSRMDEADLLKTLRQCTWGLTLMDVTDKNPRYNRFSFPNKFGTYLSAGLPLIVIAHSESSAAKIAKVYHLGVYTDCQDVVPLAKQLLTALVEENPRQRFRSEILRCAQNEFDAMKMRRQLWAHFGVK